MQYLDPLLVVCDNCGFKKEYPLNQLRALDACCTECKYSLEQVGVNINATYKEVSDFISLVEIILEVEDKFSIEISDTEAELILTVQDFLNCIGNKSSITEKEIVPKLVCIFKKIGIELSYPRDSRVLLSELNVKEC